jgi:hypothetical protein
VPPFVRIHQLYTTILCQGISLKFVDLILTSVDEDMLKSLHEIVS